jgi:hypothetical protein
MTREIPKPDDRSEVLVALRHGLDRTLLLARTMFDDPLVGSEARAFHSQLAAIQAEVDWIEGGKRPPVSSGDRISGQGLMLWQ